MHSSTISNKYRSYFVLGFLRCNDLLLLIALMNDYLLKADEKVQVFLSGISFCFK